MKRGPQQKMMRVTIYCAEGLSRPLSDLFASQGRLRRLRPLLARPVGLLGTSHAPQSQHGDRKPNGQANVMRSPGLTGGMKDTKAAQGEESDGVDSDPGEPPGDPPRVPARSPASSTSSSEAQTPGNPDPDARPRNVAVLRKATPGTTTCEEPVQLRQVSDLLKDITCVDPRHQEAIHTLGVEPALKVGPVFMQLGAFHSVQPPSASGHHEDAASPPAVAGTRAGCDGAPAASALAGF
ncbi:hypothetical protein H920_07261 [Fukomys damarensis]|uniref:Uncharacterized protein n=1 Tax=Fukomys damarensis TaxID=885580 RepID=A0A091E861_FUKDA|nr:hypothetical protein H920_07261 [Fukomys damarensis]